MYIQIKFSTQILLNRIHFELFIHKIPSFTLQCESPLIIPQQHIAFVNSQKLYAVYTIGSLTSVLHSVRLPLSCVVCNRIFLRADLIPLLFPAVDDDASIPPKLLCFLLILRGLIFCFSRLYRALYSFEMLRRVRLCALAGREAKRRLYFVCFLSIAFPQSSQLVMISQRNAEKIGSDTKISSGMSKGVCGVLKFIYSEKLVRQEFP